jgi:hypothetical protein
MAATTAITATVGKRKCHQIAAGRLTPQMTSLDGRTVEQKA